MPLHPRPHFMWNCPWRIEWRRSFEYWDRCQFGPFYMLLRKRPHPRTRGRKP